MIGRTAVASVFGAQVLMLSQLLTDEGVKRGVYFKVDYFCGKMRSGFTDNLLKRAKKEKIALFQKDKFVDTCYEILLDKLCSDRG